MVKHQQQASNQGLDFSFVLVLTLQKLLTFYIASCVTSSQEGEELSINYCKEGWSNPVSDK